MATLRFSENSRRDMEAIFDYIARDKPTAAARWIDKIEEKCELISGRPEIGEQRNEFGADIRSCVVGRYVIFYRPFSDGTEIVRIIAGDRDIRSL